MKMQTSVITLAILAGLSCAAWADFCAVCGTDPCRVVARARNLPVNEPPSPALAPEGNLAVGGLISRLFQGAGGLKNDLE